VLLPFGVINNDDYQGSKKIKNLLLICKYFPRT